LAIFAGPGVIAMILATCGVTTSRPPTPPAPSAAQDSESFFTGLKQVFKFHTKIPNTFSGKIPIKKPSIEKAVVKG
jgi:hypothetical protein